MEELPKLSEEAKVLLELRDNCIDAMAINNAGSVLLYERTETRRIMMWDAVSGELRWEQPTQAARDSERFVIVPKSTGLCALAEDGTAYLGDRSKSPSVLAVYKPDGRRGRRVRLPVPFVTSLALTRDGSRLAIVGSLGDGQPRIFDTAKLRDKPLTIPKGHSASASMEALSWSEDGRWLLSLAEVNDYNYTLAVREPGKKVAWKGKADTATMLGNHVVTWTQQEDFGEFEMCNPGQKEPLKAGKVKTPYAGVGMGIAAINGGAHLAVLTGRYLFIVDTSTFELVAAYASSAFKTCASPDGRFLLLYDSDARTVVVESSSLLDPSRKWVAS